MKIRKREEIAELVSRLKKQGKKIGFTSGAFDIFHAGHVDYLQKAKDVCDVLIIGLNSDESIKEYKDKNRPINTWKHRAKVLSALESVDYIFSFDEKNNHANIELLKPDFYIKAGDYDVSRLTSKPIVEKCGGRAVLIPVEEDTSGTEIIKKIKSLESADKLNENTAEYIPLKDSDEKIKAIFLDRDGTINVDHQYTHEIEKFAFTPNAVEGLKRMQELGYKLIIVTDQPGIGLGYYTKEDFYAFNRHIFRQLAPHNIRIDKIYFCPHSINDNCSCRKPKTALVERAQEYYNGRIDMENSFFIGDKTSDIKCGKDAGLRTILVRTGSAGKDGRHDIKADFVAEDLLDAARLIENK